MSMTMLDNITIKIFADGANLQDMLKWCKDPLIQGFTTNPTLMRKAGVTDYAAFAHEVLHAISNLPVSFEIFADRFDEMKAQALKVSGWGDNVYVKIPVSNTQGMPSYPLIRELADAGVKQNITAVMTLDQVQHVVDALKSGPEAYISVFAGRIADTGEDPVPLMQSAFTLLRPFPQLQLLWASVREVINIFQAQSSGCDVVTVTDGILKKILLVGKDLTEYSLETVRMFHQDAQLAGFSLETADLIPTSAVVDCSEIDQVV
jgi:transaldolase